MIIRKAKPKDTKGCMNLLKQEKQSHFNSSDFEKSAKDRYTLFLVAEENSKIIGYILGFIVPTRRTEAMIHETRVDKKARHKKIGTMLVDNLCREMHKKGAKNIYALIKQKHKKFYISSCRFKKSNVWIEVKK